MTRVSWAHLVCVAFVACGGDTRSRGDAGTTSIPPPSPPIDASVRDTAPPPPRDGGPPRDLGPCRTNEIECDGRCVDVQVDSENCGTCGVACRRDGSCVRGACQCECGGGPWLMTCGACECVDILNNPQHCGSCDNVCADGMFCVGGACECPDPLTLCDGACVNLQADNANCGAYGNTCMAGAVCLAGICDNCACSALDCCPTGCADLQNDPNNCGMCGAVVPPGLVCQNGIAGCPPGTQECSGVCVALNDPNHCGACGTVCETTCVLDVATGTASCVTGCDADASACDDAGSARAR